MKIREACSLFVDQEARRRNLQQGTINGYKAVFRSLSRWADENGLAALEELDESKARAWVGSWAYRPSTTRRKLIQLKAFFRFAVERGWLLRSPVATLRLPKSDSPPTMPLTEAEVLALLGDCEKQPKERALILLMRHSGLAIGDAVTLKRASIVETELTLRRVKGGELVTVELPLAVVTAIRAIRGANPDYFWWTGRGQPITCERYWRSRLRAIARRAGVEGFRPPRLRDTFAVAMLAEGVPMRELSRLLGHTSVSTTERYYAPWDRRPRGTGASGSG